MFLIVKLSSSHCLQKGNSVHGTESLKSVQGEIGNFSL